MRVVGTKITLILGLSFSALLAHANGNTTTVLMPFVCATYPCEPPAKWPLFDDRVFNLESKEGPATSTSATGQTRALGRDRDYNYVQRDAWIKQCAYLQNDSMARFRDCFETERSKAAQERERRQDEINRERNAPYRNVPPRDELSRRAGKKRASRNR